MGYHDGDFAEAFNGTTGGYYDYNYGDYTYVYYSNGYPEPESDYPVIDAFEKSFATNNVECSVIDGTTYVYGIASANSTATLSWEGTSRANAYVAWGLTGDDGYIPFPETFVVNIAEDGLSGTFTGDFYLPDVTNINRRPFVGTFECGT